MREITSLDELKKIELEIMKKIHEFCVENNIQYFLTYGTLIGAVRHKGFIPWDDDIDIYMTRSEYNRFLDIFPDYAKQNNLSIANPYTENYYGRPMTKVYDNRTFLTEPDFRSDDPYGVFVDIWILDGFPSDDEVKWLNKMKKEKKKLLASCLRINRKYSFKKNISIFFGKFINHKKQCRKFDLLASTYAFEQSEKCMCYMLGLNNYFPLNREWFKEAILCEFEDSKFYIPAGYDKILRTIYGDYNILPPPEQQKPHHVINTYWK